MKLINKSCFMSQTNKNELNVMKNLQQAYDDVRIKRN